VIRSNDNQIWWSWKDGLGYVAHDNEPAYPGNVTGSIVGDENTLSFTEETIVNGGNQSMPFWFDNNKQDYSNYSEVELTLTDQRDWTEQGVANLSLWFRGNPASVGSFVEAPFGTYTITASGADIWGQSDEFHFAYKTLSGQGSMIAKVVSITDTHNSAKAAVMIRDTLAPDSKYWMAAVTPGSGVIADYRAETGENVQGVESQPDITAPYWVKVERNLAGNFTAYSSANGSTWQKLGVAELIPMGSNVHIGLALTAHNASATCEAVISNVTTTGDVIGQWMHQDIGIASNDVEPLYVAVSNSAGVPAVVVNDEPAAIEKLGRELKAMGLTLAYHNHDIELRNAAREFHHMMAGTDPAYVTLCLDAHWIYRGAGNSSVALFDVLKLYGSRITELHLRQSRDNIWTEAMCDGDIDYEALAKHLLQINVRPHLVMEQAVESSSPKTMSTIEAFRKSSQYARRVFAAFA